MVEYSVGAASEGFYLTAVPERPEELEVTAITNDSISVSWRPPKYDGGAEITQYILESRLIGKDKFTPIGGEEKLMDKKFTHAGLKEGSSHEFRVSAVNQVGKGKASFCTKPIQVKVELGEHCTGSLIWVAHCNQCVTMNCGQSTLLLDYLVRDVCCNEGP